MRVRVMVMGGRRVAETIRRWRCCSCHGAKGAAMDKMVGRRR